MALKSTEAVMVSRSKFERLKRDAAILDMVESEYRRKTPGGPTLRAMFGGLMDSAANIDAILAAHVRRLEARGAALPPEDPRPARRRA